MPWKTVIPDGSEEDTCDRMWISFVPVSDVGPGQMDLLGLAAI
jgi:hypothetical protein